MPSSLPTPDETAYAAGPATRWSRVRTLFEQLLECDAHTRLTLVAQAQTSDADVAREAMALLAQHEAEEGSGAHFLALPAAQQVGAGPGAGFATRSGQRLGPWRLQSMLGEGGMGEVWEAFRADGRYDARVAIKVIKPGVDSQAVLERFALEQRMLARLNHPHIARLLDAGITEGGAPYFVLEAVQGAPIDRACSGLSLRQRLRLFLQLADAVAFAHRQLLVHRDLKPGNVLVNDDGQVKLLDFGIARALAGDAGEGGETGGAGHAAGHASEGAMLGLTPAFASPEQVRGAPVGTATDVYSLGLLLHLMLTGTRAYGREAHDVHAALRAVLEESPTPPSAAPQDHHANADPGVPRAELRGDIDALVERCLHKNPEQRYASVDALAADVRAWLDGRVLAATAATPWRRALKFMQRNRAASVAAAVALLGVLLGLGASASQGREMVAGLALLVLVAGVAASAWQARQAAAARDQAEARLQDTRLIARDIVLRYADTISFLPGGAQLKASLLTDTIAHLERLALLSPREAEDSAIAGDLAMAHARLADVQGVDNDLTLNDAEACRLNTERALALFPRGEAAHRNDPRYVMWWARCLHLMAKLRRHAGDAEGMLLWNERQRDLLQLAAPRFPDDADLQHELGSTWIGIGQAHDTWSRKSLEQPQAAAEAFEQARVVFEGLIARNANDSVAHHQLGVLHGGRMLSLYKQARGGEAVQAGVVGVQHKRAALALEPTNVAYRQALSGECNNLAMVLNDERRFDEALVAAREAVDQLIALERDDPQLVLWGQRRRFFSLHLGRALLGTGQAQEAVAPLRDCLQESAAAAAGVPRRRRGHNQLLLAQALAALGDGSAAACATAARADLEAFHAEDAADAEGARLLAELEWFEACVLAKDDLALAGRAGQPGLHRAHALLKSAELLAPSKPHARWLSQQVALALPQPAPSRASSPHRAAAAPPPAA